MPAPKTDNLSDSLTINLPEQQDSKFDIPYIGDLTIPDNGISFYIPRLSRAFIVSSEGGNFFIGRSIEPGRAAAPMLNLEDLNGFAMGVSRRHAMVMVSGRGYEVIDLASRNGTWLYDQRLIPNKSYPMSDGSLLRVGQERLLVRYHSS